MSDTPTGDSADARINAIFLDNLGRSKRNEPLINEVTQL